MRSEFIRIYKSVHTWTGIISGMALFIAFYAGALTLFKEPLRSWSTPPAAQLQAVSPDAVQALIQHTLTEVPAAARGFTLRLADGQAIPRLEWRVNDSRADDHDESRMHHYTAIWTADKGVQVSEVSPPRLVEFIDVVHRVVGLPVDTDPNRWIMGVVAVLYSLALFSGLIVLLPSLVKDFFALRVGSNRKRMWLDAHNVVGIIGLPFHLVIALSSVVFAYHDQIYSLQDQLLRQGQPAFQAAKSSPPPARDPATLLTPGQLLQRVQQQSASFVPTHLEYHGLNGPHPTVRVWGKDATGIAPRAVGGFAALDPYSGKLISTDFMAGHQDTPNLLISSFFALHMATFAGATGQWLYFLLGLSGAWLFYSGNLLWVESRRKKQRAQQPATGPGAAGQRRDAWWLAAINVGVCLGCVAGLSLTIAAAKWLPVQWDNLASWHMGIYYLVFFASLAWACLRGAARAAVELLWLAAGCTLLIPLSSLAGWLLPALGAWYYTTPAALGVDLTAALGAVALLAMARATAQRVRHGPADSLWSAAQDAPATAPAVSLSAATE